MRTTTAATTAGLGRAALLQRVTAGVVGGLAGGLVFGVMMQLMDMMGMVAQLVGSSSVAVGWVVHLAISAFFGAAFTVALAGLIHGLSRALPLGAVYGVVLWVIGPLLLMPAFLGMPLFVINDTTLLSLVGHVAFGLVLGLVAAAMLRRRPA
ncbi:hypothetical protein SAMN06272737_1672 [Blastococcus mobilis]|uniref:Uncharacterized protein n=2 Tax=Blastococcus mobilis TaxID=1938746 RepID=A0A239B0P2_9ACTN|nr:hypothetical protein SAMN06272737_1672 [Blastococcus mobilis]